MDEDNDVFQDFDSDASDFDDNVDLDFTDGESASILQLMSGADSTKKAQSQRIGATPLSGVVHNNSSPSNMSKNVSKILAANAPKVQAGGSFDGELLDEAFPESKLEITIKPTEQRVDVAHSRNKECEVEWALMALEEHEQLGRQLPAKADVDFLKLFEEMYGGDTAITLSTPSPPAKREGGEQGSFSASQSIENQDAVAGNVSSSPQITETSDEMIPAEILDMLQSIYRKAIELIQFVGESYVYSRKKSEESRFRQVISTDSRRKSSKIKWAKMIDMLPLLAKDQKREQQEQEVENVSAMNLIAKGSQRILLKNGMWTETLDERLNRLAKHQDESRHTESPTVTFIQFSCALLYFGFVVNLNTPWEDGKNDSSDNEITLLWHSWTVFTRDDSGVPGSKLAMKVLERILFSVILGDRAGNHSMFRCRDVQTLLRLYRANYYARKHTQLNEEPSGGHRQNTASNKPHLSSERQINKRGTLRHRVRYSMHGKPIRNSKASETDMLSEREQLVQERINEMREAKAKQELEGCTFHPRINPRPSWSSARQSLSPRPASCSSDTVSTFERLYSDAFQRQNNVLEKYLESRLHREELEKRESKVQPSYVNGLTIEERLENLHVALAGNALPVNFHKKINAMRAATEMKALNEQIKEQRLQPAQFKRAKDGSTVVLPFQLATEIRAAMNTDLKKQRINIAQRPRDLMMKDLRPLDEKQKREVLAPTQPPLRDNCCEGDMCLDVHLSPSETHQLHLNVNDDPREVVERFAQRFSLTNTQRHFLLQLVEARLEQLTSY
ncbi:Hypothetical protein PHPALM_9788 [Phytophthora palmivora]|uniref:FERM domain-containing protein n=1 Tax=Phytophthora palmivora TaxID=4796 RepID=A0A2P4Y6D9_9STRA|nr:Hypothetical protein PHPALM_9788 [Phytophthora palmivora]